MRSLTLSLSFILLLSLTIKAQEIISSSGDFFNNGNISVSWTIGEPVTETIANGNNIFTQGFQQSCLNVTNITEVNSDLNIKIFPNPAGDYINLTTDKFYNLNYEIIDINGKTIEKKAILSDNTNISFSNCHSSVYFLKIYGNGKQAVKIFKIIKH